MCDTGVIHKSGIYHTFLLLIINAYRIKCDRVTENPEKQHKKRHPFVGAGQSCLVPAPRAGPQKDRPYQSVVYMASFNAIPRGAREQGSLPTRLHLRGMIQK